MSAGPVYVGLALWECVRRHRACFLLQNAPVAVRFRRFRTRFRSKIVFQAGLSAKQPGLEPDDQPLCSCAPATWLVRRASRRASQPPQSKTYFLLMVRLRPSKVETVCLNRLHPTRGPVRGPRSGFFRFYCANTLARTRKRGWQQRGLATRRVAASEASRLPSCPPGIQKEAPRGRRMVLG